MDRILLIEDDESVASSLQRVLEVEGYGVETATSAERGLDEARSHHFDVVVTDLQMPGPSGMDIIQQLHADRPNLPVILMTAHHTTDTAIRATKAGAFDYILKPIDQPEFLAMLGRAITSSRVVTEPLALGEASATKEAIIGKSRLMQNVYKEIGRVAAKPVTVLLRGETGTGKELAARAIHQYSERHDKPFIVVNCVAIPENLLESELFGYEAGAFTDAKARRTGRFEQAHTGTIFLDEIGDVSMGTQGKLLRVLEDKRIQRLGGKEDLEVDVRIIAATHRKLEAAIQDKEFREDLFYRLNVGVITLPPLRDRSEDIPMLVNYFLTRHGTELGPAPRKVTPDALAYLQQQTWPGNVRELENVIRKALLLSRGYGITADTIKTALAQMGPGRGSAEETFAGFITSVLSRAKRGELDNIHDYCTETFERELYGQAIRLANGDQTKAARWLGVSRPTIREKLTRYGLHPSQSSEAS